MEDCATRPVHHPTRPGEAIDAVPELQRDDTVCSGLLHAPLEWGHHARAGPPGDVKTRNGVTRPARAVAAALRPTNDREEANALLMKPGTFLARGEGDIRLSPFPRPPIFRPVEAGGRHPVLQRELMGVANTKSPLLR